MSANAQIAGWDMDPLTGGTNNFGTSPYNPTTTNANATVGGLTRGSGIGTTGSGAANAWGGNDMITTSQANAITGNDFVTFTVKANTGYTMSISGIAAYNIRRSASGSTTGIWQYSTDGSSFTDIGTAITWGSTTSAAGNAQSAIDLSGISALQNVLSSTTITFRIVLWGGTGTAGTWYINDPAGTPGDDFIVNGTLTSASNSITAPTTPSNVTLANCAATQNITITGATSTGTFNAGNNYTAQLSDASGSFTTPIATASVASTSNTVPDITLVVPAGTATGTDYRVRVISDNPSAIGGQSGIFTINQGGTCVSNASDFFRSRQTGDWATTTTWQSSSDNTNWINATLVPDQNANAITIRNGHTVTVSSNVTFDQLTIEDSGVLNHTGGTITINDGTGTDATIIGFWRHANGGGVPSGTGTIAVQSGAFVEITNGASGTDEWANDENATFKDRIDWQNGSVCYWNNAGTFSTSNIIYFPNAVATVAPIFINKAGALGGGVLNPTTFNGIFIAAANTTWQNAGTKTFRNGLMALTGFTITQAANCGQLLVTGTSPQTLSINRPSVPFSLTITNANAGLGGGGNYSLTSTGMTVQVGASGKASLAGNMNITAGSLFLTQGDIDLNGSNMIFTGTGAFLEDRANGYIIYDATAINDASTGGYIEVPAPASINSITTAADVFASANEINGTGLYLGFLSGGSSPTFSSPVRRYHYRGAGKSNPQVYSTTSTATAANQVILGIEYPAQGEIPATVDKIYRYSTDWQPLDATLVGRRVYTNNAIPGFSSYTSGSGSTGLPVRLLDFNATAGDDARSARLTWATATESRNKGFGVERSTDGKTFAEIGFVDGAGNSLTVRQYEYTDRNFAGFAYYRLRQTDTDGSVVYSPTRLVSATGAVSIYPNPAAGDIQVRGIGNDATNHITLSDLAGRSLGEWRGAGNAANAALNQTFSRLPAGVYVVRVNGKAVRVVKQ